MPSGGFIRNVSTERQKARGSEFKTLEIRPGHGTEMTGHVPETSGHDAEIIGHAVPKYALWNRLPLQTKFRS
jgi:hypothetical protein